MKNLKAWLFVLVFVIYAVLATSCAGGSGMGYDGYYPIAPDYGVTGDAATPPGEGVPGKEEENVGIPAGLLTAGAWNDNDNYALWKELFFQGQTEDENGKFYYLGRNYEFEGEDRVVVTVEHLNEPVMGASATCQYGQGDKICTAVTDANGKAYLFPAASEGTVVVSSGGQTYQAEFNENNREITISAEAKEVKLNVIELMFVVDVTGSMGDEINYLKAELSDVINKVVAANEQVQINLAFLFYRDHGDNEVFSYCDFVDVSNPDGMAVQQKNLAKQVASGGGDYPEALDEALMQAAEKGWSSGATTKIIFNLLDAPIHTTNFDRYASAVELASKKGIRLCPILASGADLFTEYLSREAALRTGGTFVFITDDSGIGGSHLDPELPNVTVEALNSLIVRLVNGYYTGEFADPVDWRQEV